MSKKDTFFKSVDYVCISDNYWLGKEKPCITYGLRGICYFFIEVTCAKRDLHSGVFGGSVHEAMTDLIQLMSRLVSVDGLTFPGQEHRRFSIDALDICHHRGISSRLLVN